jgi:methionine-rich copper-binding protein CopC
MWVVGGLLYAGTAYAHAAYARSEPGAGAVVSAAPTQVEIWFTQDLFRRQGENWINVTGPEGAVVHVGEAQIDDDDRRHMRVTLRADLAPGEYRVVWHSLSAEDGDEDDGDFTFTFDPQAQITSTPMAENSPAAATPTLAAMVTPPAPTTTAVPGGDTGCGAGLALAFGWAALGMGVRRRHERLS